MHDAQMADRPSLEMRWLPVADEQGATRMQAVWIDVAPASVTTHHAA